MSDDSTLTFVTESLPAFTVGQYYEQTPQSVGGWGVVIFAVESGAFPDGIDLSAEGVISGTPTDDSGDTTVFITVTDENGDNRTQAFDCEVNAAPA